MLTIDIKSFSYKKGIPPSNNEHGGGFVFDCRFIDNPGRLDEYKNLTGADKAVQQYLELNTQMPAFLLAVKNMIGEVVDRYQNRSFDCLSVYFGCTGGQHRSVYAAITFKKHLEITYNNLIINITHREQTQLN